MDLEPGNYWLAAMLEAMDSLSLAGEPLTVRAALRARVRHWATNDFEVPPRFLILLFGSLARGERAKDIDLIVVGTNQHREHQYRRIDAHGVQVDLNLVTESWLRRAWQDVEHGYWLNESYVLACNDLTLEGVWRQSCNSYWSPGSVSRRAVAHREAARALCAASARAGASGWRTLARLLGHEAARATGCALIDQYGSRIFSHRTFIAEVVGAGAFAGVTPSAMSNLRRSLGSPVGDETESFAGLRREISRLLRDPRTRLAIGYEPAATREQRVGALVRAVGSMGGAILDELLCDAGLDRSLPAIDDLMDLATTIDAILEFLVPRQPVPFLQAFRGSDIFAPSAGDIHGARWASCEGGRLKLIVNTGGCKTPSCTFCALPAYGRRSERSDLVRTLKSALIRFRPRELALYNDGNIFNPREVGAADLREACSLIRHFGVTRLSLESIPRFITYDLVASVIQSTCVERLVVALGLQCIGNFPAVSRLGRPDVDALFDRAIDEIHEAGAHIRLYLLYGAGRITPDAWDERLARSIDWALARHVDIVSICPYAPPVAGPNAPNGWVHLPRLRQIVGRYPTDNATNVEIVETGLDSCAIAARPRVK